MIFSDHRNPLSLVKKTFPKINQFGIVWTYNCQRINDMKLTSEHRSLTNNELIVKFPRKKESGLEKKDQRPNVPCARDSAWSRLSGWEGVNLVVFPDWYIEAVYWWAQQVLRKVTTDSFSVFLFYNLIDLVFWTSIN